MTTSRYSEDDFTNLILARRVRTLAQAQTGVSAQYGVDLATLDDSVANTLSQAGVAPQFPKPSLLGELVHHIINDPLKTPVADLHSFAAQLKTQGLLDQDYQFPGYVDSTFNAAARRFADDQSQQISQNHGNPFSLNVKTVLDIFNATMPSGVARTVIGMAKELLPSLLGTVKRQNLATPLYQLLQGDTSGVLKNIHARTTHISEDVVNTLTVLSLFDGVGEATAATEALAGSASGNLSARAAAMLGLDAGAEVSTYGLAAAGERLAAAKAGIGGFIGTAGKTAVVGGAIGGTEAMREGRSPVGVAAEIGLGALAGGIGGKLAMRMTPGLEGGADGFTEWLAKYGPKAQSQRPVLRLAGRQFGAFSKGVFPEALAAATGVKGPVPEAIRKAKAPKWTLAADLATLVVVPEAGLIPKPWKAFSTRELGAFDPLKTYYPDHAATDVVRGSTYLQAYHWNLAEEIKYARSDWNEIRAGGPADNYGATIEARGQAAKEMLVDAHLPSRGIKPFHAEAAMKLGQEQPHVVSAYLADQHLQELTRVRNDLIGHNSEDAYQMAEDHTGQMTNDGIEASYSGRDRRAKIAWHNKRIDEALAQGDHVHARRLEESLQATMLDEVSPHEQMAAALDHDVHLGVDKRIVPQRIDNPLTQQNVKKMLGDWEAMGGAGGNMTPEMELRLRQLKLQDVAPTQVKGQLEKYLEYAPLDLTDYVPAADAEHLASLGYRPIAGRHSMILRSDFNPDVMHAADVSKLARTIGALGLSPKPETDADIMLSTSANQTGRMEEVLQTTAPELFNPGEGQNVKRTIQRRAMEQTDRIRADAKTGSVIDRAFARAKLAKLKGFPSAPFIRGVLVDDFSVPEEIAKSLSSEIYGAMRNSAAHPNLAASTAQTMSILDQMMGALRVHGWPGMTELMRGVTVSDLSKAKVSTLLGAGLGAYEGHGGRDTGGAGQEFKDILEGTAAGALGGFLAGKGVGKLDKWAFSKFPNYYGFLPDKLMRGALALRFTFNPLFEARLFTKGQFIRGAAEDLAPVGMPYRRMVKEGNLQRYHDISARAHGYDPTPVDDATRATVDAGFMGVNMRHHATYAEGRVYDRHVAQQLAKGKTEAEADASALAYLRKHGSKLYSYGARSALEKSVNFIFFPFSFEKKVATLAADYMTAQPIRTVLAHHAMKVVDTLENMDPKQKDKLSKLMKRYVPFFHQIDKLNAFAHGLTPGEFGGLSPFGAVYKPLADALNLPVEAVRGMLMPVGIKQENSHAFKDAFDRALPGYKAVASFVADAQDQAKIIASKGHTASSSSQIDDFYTLRDGLEASFAQVGTQFGAQDNIESFMNTNAVPEELKDMYKRQRLDLDGRFPAGAMHAAQYSNTPAIQQLHLENVLRKSHKTRAEQGIVAMEALRVGIVNSPIFQYTGADSKMMQGMTMTFNMRQEALRLMKVIGPDFVDLWNSLGYAYEFGPITQSIIVDQGSA